jgi:RNA-directed DNA polymerase
MRHARDRIRDIARSTRMLPMETVVEDLNRFLGGWAAYFRYGHSHRQFTKIRFLAAERLALLLARRHNRSRDFGWRMLARASPSYLGLITLSGIIVTPSPQRYWRARPNADGERRR